MKWEVKAIQIIETVKLNKIDVSPSFTSFHFVSPCLTIHPYAGSICSFFFSVDIFQGALKPPVDKHSEGSWTSQLHKMRRDVTGKKQSIEGILSDLQTIKSIRDVSIKHIKTSWSQWPTRFYYVLPTNSRITRCFWCFLYTTQTFFKTKNGQLSVGHTTPSGSRRLRPPRRSGSGSRLWRPGPRGEAWQAGSSEKFHIFRVCADLCFRGKFELEKKVPPRIISDPPCHATPQIPELYGRHDRDRGDRFDRGHSDRNERDRHDRGHDRDRDKDFWLPFGEMRVKHTWWDLG